MVPDIRNINWPLFEKHASLPAIHAYLQAADAELTRITETRRRLEKLWDERGRQIAAGEWPPPPESREESTDDRPAG